MKNKHSFKDKLKSFKDKYTLGNKPDGSLGFMDTVNINKLLREDYSTSLIIMYEAVEQGRLIQEELVKVMNKYSGNSSKVNIYLVTDWLRCILTIGKPIHDVFMQCSNIVGKLLPDLEPCIGFDVQSSHHLHTVYEHMLYVVDGCETDKFEIKLAALFHDIGKPNVFTIENGRGSTFGHPRESAEIARAAFDFYIKLSRDEIEYITELILIHDKFIAQTDRSMRKMLNQYSIEFLDDYCVLKESDMADHVNIKGVWKNYSIQELRDKLHALDAKKHEFGIKDLEITGNDIMEKLKLKEGKVVGDILRQLFNEVMTGRTKNKHDDLIARACTVYRTGNK